MPRLVGIVALLACIVTSGIVAAQDIHGRIELQDIGAFESGSSLDSLLGYRDRNDALADVRLVWEPHWNRWEAGFAYDLTGDYGDSVALTDRISSLGVLPAPLANNWWKFTNTFVHDTRLIATQRIDRLWVGYADSHLVVRIGRQALTWGSGLVFHPMDLFNPWAPNATDIEYKLGTDMIYGQWLFDDGSDLQIVIVPRPKTLGGALTSNTSSYALHYHMDIGPLHSTWLVARDRADWTGAAGLNGTLMDATWNAEIIPTAVRNGPALVSGVANISDATNVYDHDITLFAEYYRNGFGLAARRYALVDLPAPLRDRLLRDQVFDTGHDYLAAGANVQCTALLQFNPTLIANLDDGGFFGIAQATYSVREDLNLVVGGQIPLAPRNTEFGGLPVIEQFPIYIEQPREVYVQLRQYF